MYSGNEINPEGISWYLEQGYVMVPSPGNPWDGPVCIPQDAVRVQQNDGLYYLTKEPEKVCRASKA